MSININTVSLQVAMDYAVQGLAKQKVQSLNPDGDCSYGSTCGTKHCAVGWLLDHDNEYLMGVESSVRSLLEHDGDLVPDIIHNHPAAFQHLQDFHDCQSREERTERAEMLRDRFDIDISESHWKEWIELGSAV